MLCVEAIYYRSNTKSNFRFCRVTIRRRTPPEKTKTERKEEQAMTVRRYIYFRLYRRIVFKSYVNVNVHSSTIVFQEKKKKKAKWSTSDESSQSETSPSDAKAKTTKGASEKTSTKGPIEKTSQKGGSETTTKDDSTTTKPSSGKGKETAKVKAKGSSKTQGKLPVSPKVRKSSSSLKIQL